MWRVLLLVATLVPVPMAVDGAELTLNNVNGPPFTTRTGDGFLDRVAGQAFKRAGVDLRLIELPAERGLLNANAGIEDGDLTRIAGLEQQYPNLVRVPEKLVDWHFSAFSRRADVTVDGWGSLLRYRVGFIRGWKIAESNLGAAAGVVPVDDEDELFDLLRLDRVDVVVYSREMGAEYIRRRALKGINLLEPPIATRGMFIYLHKKHGALVPKVAEALRELKLDGTYAREYRATVAPALRPALERGTR
jgi:polar amino acid transport system substrate-binding protein